MRVLASWYRSGIDVDTRMVALATYLGHVNITDTYWYISTSPELIALVAQRLSDQPAGVQR